MEKSTLKKLRTDAEAMIADGISTRETLIAALPTLVELQEALHNQKAALAAATKVATMLSEHCTAYARKHQSVFDIGKLVPNQQKVLIGDISLDDSTYHLACGYDGYQRLKNGERITQDFLATLPETWCKTKVELSVTGINQENPTEEKLAEYGLREKPKNVWSKGLAV